MKFFNSSRFTRVSRLSFLLMDQCIKLLLNVEHVLVPLVAEDDKYSGSKAVGKNVAALTCELEGILLGLELAVRYFESSQYRKHTENVYILCDCSSAIDVTVNRLYTATCLELFTRLAHFEGVLSDVNVNIVLSWIPGHQGILFNQTADCLAKETAREIYTGNVSAMCFVTYNDSVKIAADIARKS